ncbi:MAG TPA: alpha-amylase family glycosyl hydrolase, partial [Candidatus Limnocylindrales bacterium]
DNNVEWDGLRHDSRDLLYRTPGGAVPAGTPVTLRLRTFWQDASGVRLRVFSVNAEAEQQLDMTREADGVDCYDEALEAAGDRCDFWSVTLDNGGADNLWYRFIVSDGAKSAYYADDTAALDGGAGRATPAQIDNSYALTVFEAGFAAPDWARSAVVYQIFPDRFRNGDPTNDPQTGDVRYDDPVLALAWDELPEGWCRNHVGASALTCPWRYDDTPPSWSPDIEGPRGRDYYGGDLAGVIDKLDYLADLGVTAIYFNPLFDGGSNHGYDTQDYERIDPYFGTIELFDELTQAAGQRGIKVILDGVFNHTSSDSPMFDRYGHYDTVGACEAVDSEWRGWYYMNNTNGPCVGPGGPGESNYLSWFGFDTLPILLKGQPGPREYFLSAPDSITRLWIADHDALGWRMDVAGDPSFPRTYWADFRSAVKDANPQVLTISETWQKDSALLRNVRGDRFDSTMNYRLRDAVLGLLAPHDWDAKGFPDSGHALTASQFAARMLSQQEDYPPATYYSLMNLLDSHDTERILWTLTPGTENRDKRELDADNLAAGKARLRLASLIQYSVPGMPTVFYGDEVGLTGDDDPDDRRTYPWADLGGTPDESLLAHYQDLAQLRRDYPALVDGDLRVLLADDAAGVVVLGRRTAGQAVIVAMATGDGVGLTGIPYAGFVPEGTTFDVALTIGDAAAPGTPTASGNGLAVLLNGAQSAVVLVSQDGVDLAAPAPPQELRVIGFGDGSIDLEWQESEGAAGYNVYRSPLAGGGWRRVNDEPIATDTLSDAGLENGRLYHYVVTALDAAGNESGYSNEVAETPRLTIDAAELAGPLQVSHTISAVTPSEPICATALIDGRTGSAGPEPSLQSQLGFGPAGSDPQSDPAWTWIDAALAGADGERDRHCASLLPEQTGDFAFAFRFSTTNGRDWQPASGVGQLNVAASADTSPPATPANVRIVSATPAGIELAWDAAADPTDFGWEVLRTSDLEGEVIEVGQVTEPTFTDLAVSEGETFFYSVVALDTSFNRSAPSAPLEATAEPRLVEIVFNVSVPVPSGEAIGRPVHIAGTLSRLDGELPDWDAAATEMEQVDETHWTITLHGAEGTELEYKYALGDFLYVEKDAGCGEIANRRLTIAFVAGGPMVVNDEVPAWRNVAPCGN